MTDCFGWIKLHRGLKDKGFYCNIKYLAVWIDILLSANHKDKKIVTLQEHRLLQEKYLDMIIKKAIREGRKTNEP